MVVAFTAHRPGTSSPRSLASTSPAAPFQTVHAVLRHTASRHRSPQCMRSPVIHCSTQPVDPEAREPPVVEAGGPVATGNTVLVAGQDRHPLVDVAVDYGELLR